MIMPKTFSQFEAEALADGFDEVLERIWPADAVLPIHTHPFAVRALVVHGEMWLTQGEAIRRLLPGDVFTLGKDEAHAERYGASGASYWVARRGQG